MARNYAQERARREAKARSEGYESYGVKRRYLKEFADSPAQTFLDRAGKPYTPTAVRSYVDNLTRYGRTRTHARDRRRWRISDNDFTDMLDDYPDVEWDWEEWRDVYSES